MVHFILRQLRLLECPLMTTIYFSIISSHSLPALHLPPSSFTAGSQAPIIALGMLRDFWVLILTQYILSLMKWRLIESALVTRGSRGRLQGFEVRGVGGIPNSLEEEISNKEKMIFPLRSFNTGEESDLSHQQG